jgi:hypothetical protein
MRYLNARTAAPSNVEGFFHRFNQAFGLIAHVARVERISIRSHTRQAHQFLGRGEHARHILQTTAKPAPPLVQRLRQTCLHFPELIFAGMPVAIATNPDTERVVANQKGHVDGRFYAVEKRTVFSNRFP